MKICFKTAPGFLLFGRVMISRSCSPILEVFHGTFVCITPKKSQSCCGHTDRFISHWQLCFCPLFALQIHPGASQMFSVGYCIQEGIWPMYGPQKCLIRSARTRGRCVAKLDVCCSSNLNFSAIYYLQAFAFRAEGSETGVM